MLDKGPGRLPNHDPAATRFCVMRSGEALYRKFFRWLTGLSWLLYVQGQGKLLVSDRLLIRSRSLG